MLLDILLANRLGPVVARALRRNADAGVDRVLLGESAAIVAAVHDDARAAAQRSLGAIQTLADVGTSLDRSGIRWLLWKGPALALTAWGEPGVRHVSDLDIVVRPQDRDAARAVLARDGWQSRDGLSRAQERAIHCGMAAYPLTRGEDILVELHWAFASRRYPVACAVADAMHRAVSLNVGTRSVLAPGPADALLLLALHATKHGWSQAEEVLTFVRLAERDPSALGEACERAAVEGLGVVMGLAVRLAEELTGVVLAVPAMCRGDDPRARALAAECLGRMAAGDGAWRDTIGWGLAWIRPPAARVRFVADALLAPTLVEWRWLRLPDALVWAYPAVRLARLGVRSVGGRA